MAWLDGFNKRIKLTVDHTKIDEVLTHFPVTVKITDTDFFEEMGYNIDDTFTGSNGDLPNPKNWSLFKSNNSTIDIQDNELNITVVSTTADEYNSIRSNYTLTGDFDVQVDFNDIVTGNDVNYSGPRLVFDIDSKNSFMICAQLNSSAQKQFMTAITIDGSTTYTYPSRTNIYGKLRLVRSSSTITIYYIDGTGSTWTVLTTHSSFPTSDGYIRLAYYVGSNGGTCSADFDNYVINLGTPVQFDTSKKVVFTKDDGVTQLYGEIEQLDYRNNKVVYHVSKSDWTISPSIDTDFYLYYNKNAIDNISYIGNIGSTVGGNVWDSNFVGVWHMCQDPSGGSGCIKDSTSNSNDGTSGGSMTSGDLVDGKVGKALDFDGSDDYAHRANLSISTRSSCTLEATTKLAQSGINQRLITFEDATTPDNHPQFFIRTNGSNFAQVFSRGHENDTPAIIIDDIDLNDAAYHYIAGTINGDIGKAELFVAGVSQGSVTQGQFTLDTMPDIVFGAFLSTPSTQFLKGIIDEGRVSSVIRSASWIKATYDSLFDNLVTKVEEDQSSINAIFFGFNF